MEFDNVVLALKVIANAQRDCAPVKLKVGYTDDGMVQHDEVVLIDAPPSVMFALQMQGFHFSMVEAAGGLVLEDYKVKEVSE
jgi:hypothetical protein